MSKNQTFFFHQDSSVIRQSKIVISNDKLEKSAAIVRALANLSRMLIINKIEATSHNKLDVTDLHTQLGMRQAVCSYHLKILREVDIVTFERKGQNIYYSTNDKLLDKYKVAIHNFIYKN